MSTLTGPDLENARLAIEALMDDACRITYRLQQDLEDDVLDLRTLELVSPGNEPVERYTGKCMFKKAKASALDGRDKRDGVTQRYEFKFPIGIGVQRGDFIEVLSSRRSPSSAGIVVQALVLERSTFQVATVAECVEVF